MRTREVMTSPAVTVPPDARVKDVAALLVERGISAVPVVEADGVLVGIVSEADLVPLETLTDPRSQTTPTPPPPDRVPHTVHEIMTRRVQSLPDDADVTLAARLMIEHGYKSVPIVSGRRVVGMVTRKDLVRVLARSDEAIQEELGRRVRREAEALDRVGVEVVDGLVTFSGALGDGSRPLLELLARSVPGVVGMCFADEPR